MLRMTPDRCRPMASPKHIDGRTVPCRLRRKTLEGVAGDVEHRAVVASRARDVAAGCVHQDVDPAPFAEQLIAGGGRCASSMTSATSTRASAPAFFSASTFRSAASRRRPRIATRAPAAASPSAMLPPRTPYPPVMTATLPSSENGLGCEFMRSSWYGLMGAGERVLTHHSHAAAWE